MRKLILVFLLLLVTLTAAAVEQTALAAKLTRLHVIAASDSAEDQRQKLFVRNALLREAPAILSETDCADELTHRFEETARAELQRLGADPAVSVRLGRERYGLRRYDSFALPAGDYRSLRVVLGEGAGQNWWCVLFPPLCFATAEEWVTTAEAAGLSEEEMALITESDGYVVRFRLVELVEKLLALFRI